MTHRGEVHAIAFGSGGRAILTAGATNAAQIWHIRDAEPEPTILPYESWPTAIAFNPSGRALVIGGLDHSARIIDVDSGKPVGSPLKHDDEVTSASFSHDGTLIASGGDDRSVRLWDAATGGADKALRLWNAETGAPAGPAIVDRDAIRVVVFAPDGQTFFLASCTGTSRLFDLVTREPLGPSLHDGGFVLAAVFDRSGTHVLSGHEDKRLRGYTVPRAAEGDAAHIVSWVQLRTNMEIDADGGVRALDPKRWKQLAGNSSTAARTIIR